MLDKYMTIMLISLATTIRTRTAVVFIGVYKIIMTYLTLNYKCLQIIGCIYISYYHIPEDWDGIKAATGMVFPN